MISFKSHITNTLLGFFFLNTEQSLYINELANKLDLDPGNLFRKLKELEANGILKSEMRGNQKYYQLNHNFPLLKEYKKTFEFTNSPVIQLETALTQLKGINNAYIFGSYANNTFQLGSDIDLLLIGTHSSIEAKRNILPLEKKFGREINILNITPSELAKRQKNKESLISNIFRNKLIKLM